MRHPVVYLALMLVAPLLGCAHKAAPAPADPVRPAPTADAPPAAVAPAVPDRRPEVFALLDQIDAQLKECEAHGMKDVGKHADAIHDSAKRLADPVAQFAAAAALQSELVVHAEKFEAAARKRDHKDSHLGHRELVRVAPASAALVNATVLASSSPAWTTSSLPAA